MVQQKEAHGLASKTVRVFELLERMSKIRDSNLPVYFSSSESGKRIVMPSSPDQHADCCGSDDYQRVALTGEGLYRSGRSLLSQVTGPWRI
jgi:hypothetical protein